MRWSTRISCVLAVVLTSGCPTTAGAPIDADVASFGFDLTADSDTPTPPEPVPPAIDCLEANACCSASCVDGDCVYGAKLWEVVEDDATFSHRAVLALEDGGLLIAGVRDGQGFAARTSALGHTLETTLIQGKPQAVTSTSDGGYAIISTDESTYVDQAVVTRLDAQLSESWRVTVAHDLHPERPRAVIEASNGDVIVAGHRGGGSQATPRLIRVDSNGLEAWSRVFASSPGEARGVQEMSDGRLLVVGSMSMGPPTFQLGGHMFTATGNGESEPNRRDIAFTPLDGLVRHPAGGFVAPSTNNDSLEARIVRLGEGGQLLWITSLGTRFLGPQVIRPLADGDSLHCSSNVDTSSIKNLSVGRIDPLGNFRWRRAVGEPGRFATCLDLAPLSDGIALARRGGDRTTRLTRLDAWGRSGCSLDSACNTLATTDCVDGASCTADDCDPVSGCVNTPAPVDTPCSTGDLCIPTATCDASQACVGQPVPPCR